MPTTERPALDLTERQKEVLVAYLRAGTVAEAAKVVGITPRGVKHLLDVVKRKLNVHRNSDLLMAVVRNKIVTFDELVADEVTS